MVEIPQITILVRGDLTMSEEIKRCPFCGGKAILIEHQILELTGFCDFMRYVECTKCGARTVSGWLKKEAIDKWNNEELKA